MTEREVESWCDRGLGFLITDAKYPFHQTEARCMLPKSHTSQCMLIYAKALNQLDGVPDKSRAEEPSREMIVSTLLAYRSNCAVSDQWNTLAEGAADRIIAAGRAESFDQNRAVDLRDVEDAYQEGRAEALAEVVARLGNRYSGISKDYAQALDDAIATVREMGKK